MRIGRAPESAAVADFFVLLTVAEADDVAARTGPIVVNASGETPLPLAANHGHEKAVRVNLAAPRSQAETTAGERHLGLAREEEPENREVVDRLESAEGRQRRGAWSAGAVSFRPECHVCVELDLKRKAGYFAKARCGKAL